MRVRLALLGDSIAFGQGASSTRDTIGARLAQALSDGGVTTELHVLAVPRARSDQLDRQATAALSERAQVAVVIVGANDLTHFVPPDQAAAQLGAAVRPLVEAGVQVVVAPAPDLSVVPWVPPQFQLLVASASRALRQAQTREALAAGAHVADLDVVSESIPDGARDVQRGSVPSVQHRVRRHRRSTTAGGQGRHRAPADGLN